LSERLVLVDGTALVYRAFFGLPQNLQTRSGLYTNAVYGFATMFSRILSGKQPRFGAVVFDAPGKTFREEAYPEYKSQRPAMPGELSQQLPWIRKVVEAHDFPILQVPGVEADDVIGTLTRLALEAGHEVHIISGDKDFAQLIGPGVRMLDTMRDVTYDAELVRKKWGVLPEQFVDFLALVGDKSDNIPGVPGVGAKGAAKLLSEFGSLAVLLESTEQLRGRQRSTLTEHRELAELSRKLATIDQHVALPLRLEDLQVPAPETEKVNAVYRELEFWSLLGAEEGEHDLSSSGEITIVNDLDHLARILGGIDGEVGVHVLREQGPPRSELAGLAIALSAEEAVWVPRSLCSGLAAWLEDAQVTKIVHDLRDSWTTLRHNGLGLEGVVFDVALASFLVDPSGLVPHDLPRITKWYLQRSLPPAKAVTGSGRSQRSFADSDPDQVAAYAGRQACAALELKPLLQARVEELGQTEQLLQRDQPLARVLGQMQLDGIRVDDQALLGLQREFQVRKDQVEAEIHQLAGRAFNVASTQQLGAVLFDELGLPVIKRTKTGYSTNAEVLERLAPQHEIAKAVLRWRALAKLINTYTQVLRDAQDPIDGRIHATFQQCVGVSGRLITTDPDLQRTPIRTEDGRRIRDVFLPREGWLMVSADWSQIELRVLAHFSQDPLLIKAFREDLDLHAQTAGFIFELPPDEVSREQRNVGKTVNFATIYGQGATALGQQLGIPRKQAVAMIDRYFDRYAGVRDWVAQAKALAHEQGYVTTLLGRRRLIPELSSANGSDRGYGERVAANTPIQGSAADLCKQAMLGIQNDLEGMQARMLLQIHDELVLECPPEELQAVLELVRRNMEQPWPLSVPLKVDVGTGSSWGEAH
jgi:DNA polymerase-1